MKKNHKINIIIICIACYILFNSQSAISQITLDNNSLPNVGSQYFIKVDSLQSVKLLPGDTGRNVTWDFSNLNYCCGSKQNATDTLSWILPSSTTNGSKYPLANLALKKSCTSYHSHTTHTDVKTCGYDYYIKNNEGLFLYATEDPKIGIFKSNLNVLPLINYGDSSENIAMFEYEISTDSIEKVYVKTKSFADGWGSIVLPTKTYSSLRIYTKETIYDSLFVKGAFVRVNIIKDNYYYKWYAKNITTPVFVISKGFQNKKEPYYQKAFYFSETSTDIDEIENDLSNNASIYPNPFKTEATLEIKITEKIDNYSLIIYNITGTKVNSVEKINTNKIIIKSDKLKNGIYFYSLFNNNNVLKAKGKFVLN